MKFVKTATINRVCHEMHGEMNHESNFKVSHRIFGQWVSNASLWKIIVFMESKISFQLSARWKISFIWFGPCCHAPFCNAGAITLAPLAAIRGNCTRASQSEHSVTRATGGCGHAERGAEGMIWYCWYPSGSSCFHSFSLFISLYLSRRWVRRFIFKEFCVNLEFLLTLNRFRFKICGQSLLSNCHYQRANLKSRACPYVSVSFVAP